MVSLVVARVEVVVDRKTVLQHVVQLVFYS
jgi:hypothetical protein